MGNFHCIPESCGRVVWREYLPSTIRWRQNSDDDWNYVDGDSYQLDNQIGKCPVKYHAYGTYRSKNVNNCNGLSYWKNRTELIGTEVVSYQPIGESRSHWGIPLTDGSYGTIRPINKRFYDTKNKSLGSVPIVNSPSSSRCINDTGFAGGYNVVLTDVIREDEEDDNCGNCIFKVFKNDEIIYQETFSVEVGCPTVEQLPCRLSDISKEIKIDKFAYLERIEVIPWRYQNTLGLLPLAEGDYASYRAIIPDECLNIYKNLTVTIIPQGQSFGTPTNATQASYGFITQICSAPDCPSPEYTVICDCDCRECPAGSCAVACDGHVCCYDTTTGKAVDSIPLAEYCNDIGTENIGGGSSGGGAGGDF